MPSQSRPEPMNASSHHSKVKVTLALSDPVYVAGGNISGKMQVESRADLESLLGIGAILVELYAIQEINSGEYSATSTFIHSRRIFQGPGLPPSNAVYSDHAPEGTEFPLPAHHHPARRGQTTFFFQFLLPTSSPSSMIFGPASIKYEVRASASVAWNGDICLVTDKRDVKVVENRDPAGAAPSPQAVTITEGGKIWAQATLTNDIVVGGESVCIDLQLRNHTQRWTSGVIITLTRHLHLSQSFLAGRSSLHISDIATQVEFRRPEYSVPPGVEGIARLVIDIPRHSRGVKGGPRVDHNGKPTESFFEVRCTLKLRIDMPPGSEDTVVNLPLTIYHSLAVPEVPTFPPHPNSSSYPYGVPVSPGPSLMPLYTGNLIQSHDSSSISFTRPISGYSSDQLIEQGSHNWQYAPQIQRSMSVGTRLHAGYCASALSTSYTPSPRLLPPPPPPASIPSYIHSVAPTDPSGSYYTNPGHLQGVDSSPISQNFHLTAYHPPSVVSSNSPLGYYHYPAPQSRVDRPFLPPPIEIPSLPNPHDSQGVLHSPRPVPSPKHSFHCGSVPKSGNVSELERMAEDQVGKQTEDSSLLTIHSPTKGDAGVAEQGPQDVNLNLQPSEVSVVHTTKTLPAPPVPSSKDKHFLVQHPQRVDTVFMTGDPEEIMAAIGHHSDFPSSTTNHSHFHVPSRAPPTPPIAAITPIKFPKAPTEPSGLSVNLGKGKDLRPESGLDALERRLLAEVGTRKLHDDDANKGERQRHVRNVVVQPITIPPCGQPPDTVNDSAISSLTLADREGIWGASSPERDQEQEREHELDRDLDSDERTQHLSGGGHSPSEDDRDVRTQKGKGSRKVGRGNDRQSDEEAALSHEKPSRRKERKRAKERHEGRKMRQEARGRVAAWLGEIDISTPPLAVMMDDPLSSSFAVSPTASHFVPIAESASFDPPPSLAAADMTDNMDMDINIDEDRNDKKTEEHSHTRDIEVSTDKPNSRSSGFVTISSLKGSGFGGQPSPSPSLRRSSFDVVPTHQPPKTSTIDKGARPSIVRMPSATKVTRPSPSPAPPSPPPPEPKSESAQPTQQDGLTPGHLGIPRWPSKPPIADPGVKYDVRSARGGRGGKVTQVASLWAAKANAVNASANTNTNTNPSVGARAKANVDARPKPKMRKEKKGEGVLPMNLRLTAASTPTPTPTRRPALSTLPTSAAAAGAGVRRPPPTSNATKRGPVSVGLSLGPVGGGGEKESVGLNLGSGKGLGVGVRASTGAGGRDVSKAATKTTTTTKATTVPAVVSSSHAVPMLSSTASLARTKVHGPGRGLRLGEVQGMGLGPQGQAQGTGQTHTHSLPPMISGTISDAVRNGGGGFKTEGQTQQAPVQGRALGDLAFGQARLRDLIKKYQG